MTKSWLIGTTALVLLSTGAWAVDEKAAAPATPQGIEHGEHGMGDYVPYKDLTLEQARKHAHERADKLDKMTPEEWEAHKKKAMERREKWKAMTPEEREKKKAEFRERRMHRKEGADTAPKTEAPAGH